jgi:hypothetical protein
MMKGHFDSMKFISLMMPMSIDCKREKINEKFFNF